MINGAPPITFQLKACGSEQQQCLSAAAPDCSQTNTQTHTHTFLFYESLEKPQGSPLMTTLISGVRGNGFLSIYPKFTLAFFSEAF